MTKAGHVLAVVATPGEPAIVLEPATRSRSAPIQLVRRSVGRLRASAALPSRRERVVWGAPTVGEGRLDAVRQRLLAGEIHFACSDGSPLEAVRSEARFEPVDDLRIGAGGGLRQLGRIGSRSAILRLGVAGSPGDPDTHRLALQRFAGRLVPASLEFGVIDGVRWSIESVLPGRRPRTLETSLVTEVSRFLVELPRPEGPVDVIGRAAATLSQIAEPQLDVRAMAGRVEDALGFLPAVVVHGDLWAGNLLVDGSRLSGVIDWDSWSEGGVPGTDLVHLFAEGRRRANRASYGGVVEAHFWEAGEVSSAVARHFSAAGLEWQPVRMTDLANAWWMTTVAGAIRRSPVLAADSAWIAANVVAPYRIFAGGLR